MDLSITLITPDIMRELGAADYDRGLGINDHGMNPGSLAIKDWQCGWHGRRIERSRMLAHQDGQQLAEAAQ